MSEIRTEEGLAALRLWPAAYVPTTTAWHTLVNALDDQWLNGRFETIVDQYTREPVWSRDTLPGRITSIQSAARRLGEVIGLEIETEVLELQNGLWGRAYGILNRMEIDHSVVAKGSVADVRRVLTHEARHLWQFRRVFGTAQLPSLMALESVRLGLHEDYPDWTQRSLRQRERILRQVVASRLAGAFGHESPPVRQYLRSSPFRTVVADLARGPLDAAIDETIVLLRHPGILCQREGNPPSMLWQSPMRWRDELWRENMANYNEPPSHGGARNPRWPAYAGQVMEVHAENGHMGGMGPSLRDHPSVKRFVENNNSSRRGTAILHLGDSNVLTRLFSAFAVCLPSAFLLMDGTRVWQRSQAGETASAGFWCQVGGVMASAASLLCSVKMMQTVSDIGRQALGDMQIRVPTYDVLFTREHFSVAHRWGMRAGLFGALAGCLTATSGFIDRCEDPKSGSVHRFYAGMNVFFNVVLGAASMAPRNNRFVLAAATAVTMFFSYAQHHPYPDNPATARWTRG